MPRSNRTSRSSKIGIALILSKLTHAAFELSFRSDLDLTNYVSRPDIKIPILDVTVFDEEAALPGYWFLGPYTNITQQTHPFAVYQACQIGPVIYDAHGELVWAGACNVRNQNALDFRPVKINGTDFLSYIRGAQYGSDLKGAGVLMNSSYDVVAEVQPRPGIAFFDMHEFRLLPKGDRLTGLNVIQRPVTADLTHLQHHKYPEGWISDIGFTEVDIYTGEILFEWFPSNHIKPAESYYNRPEVSFTNALKPYDWFHTNSVEKNDDGDYLISARYTSAIYKISGQDGRVLWRLGGKQSDFDLHGFNFSFQHDARWLSSSKDEEVISFMDNGGESEMYINTTATSSGLVVALDKQSWTARVLKRWWRPDGTLTRLRGNFQTFPDSKNVVAGWSDNAYATELDETGKVLVETRFQSKRMVTYRTYKANFTGTPRGPPDLAAFAFGTSLDDSLTIVYMSWNGATEVKSWNVYTLTGDGLSLIGSTKKTGFETIFQVPKYYHNVLVEALDADGEPLPFGRSHVFLVRSNIGRGLNDRAENDPAASEAASEVNQARKDEL